MSIATEISRLQTAKADIKTAIEGKGVTVPSSTTLSGYATLIDSIQTGGGSTGYTVEEIANRYPSGDVTISGQVAKCGMAYRLVTSISLPDATSIPNRFCIGADNLASINAPNVTSIDEYAFSGCTSLESFDGENVVDLYSGSKNYIFNGCTNLASVSFPKLTGIYQYVFQNCTSLKTVHLPNLTRLNTYNFKGSGVETIVLPKYNNLVSAWQVFNGATKLKTIDIYGASSVPQQYCAGCTVLNTLILRRTTVPTLQNINAFQNTPFASGNAGGTLYVPNDLISSYQSASNWSTILGYSTNQILPIEGSIYETQYADGTPIE